MLKQLITMKFGPCQVFSLKNMVSAYAETNYFNETLIRPLFKDLRLLLVTLGTLFTMLNKSDVEIFKEVSMGGRFGKYADAELAQIRGVINGIHLELEYGLRVTGWRRDMSDDFFKKRHHGNTVMESMSRSVMAWLSRNMPLCLKNWSTRVVLP